MSAPASLAIEREGVRLACLDFGGEGPPALLLHGLAGHAGEWSETACWLTKGHRVLALDQRGHGHSERKPNDVSKAARIADVVFTIERLVIGPTVLVGQSLGGHLAILVAAYRPDLVQALVVAEASPAGAGARQADVLAKEVRASLARWPTPFASRGEAVEFFGGPSANAEAWAAGLEWRDGGLWPAFELDTVTRTLRDAVVDDHWDEWGRIRCPTLVVRGGNGTLSPADVKAMAQRRSGVQVVEIAGAGHDVHLDQPEAWRDAVCAFLGTLEWTTPDL